MERKERERRKKLLQLAKEHDEIQRHDSPEDIKKGRLMADESINVKRQHIMISGSHQLCSDLAHVIRRKVVGKVESMNWV
jgi:hypothetical protein